MSYSNYVLNERISNIQAAASVVSSKISSLQVPSAPNELVVVDTIVVADVYPTPNDTTEITPTQVSVSDSAGVAVSSLTKQSLTFLQSGPSALYELGGVLLDNNIGDTANLRVVDLVFSDPAGAAGTYGVSSLTLEDALGDYTLLNTSTLNLITGTTTSFHNSATLSFTNGATTNTLDASDWTGNIQTVNTVANLTHYLNFSDSSATGYGRPQKTAGISCNPATNTITATNFTGLASSSTTAVGVNLTSDNTAGTYYLPFSKTSTATANALFIDNTTGPLSYNPSTSTLTATSFAGSVTTVDLTSDNTAGTYYIPFSKTITANANALFIDNVTGPLSYNPSTSNLTATTFTGALSGNATTATNLALATTPTTATFATNTLTIVGATTTSFNSYTINITGTTNTLSSITYTTPRVNGWYRVGIYNAGTGDLTITATQGGTATTRTNLSANLIVPTLRYAFMEISSMTVNALQQYIANIYLLNP